MDNSCKVQFSNQYLQTYINNYVCTFRKFCKDKYKVSICGLGNFVSKDDIELHKFLNILKLHGFVVDFVNDNEFVDCFQVLYTNLRTNEHKQLNCNIDNLLYIIELSNKTNISLVGIIVIKIISRLIYQIKVLYKAIVLDLDDTLWNGTLSEVGIQSIESNLRSKAGIPYISFMNFVKILAEELGIYIAICSKNSQEDVRTAIECYDNNIFPLKGQIDCLIVNYNDKSSNISNIAKQLSILPCSIVFIDDNPIVRDEVRRHLPDVFVPEWNNHDELITLLITCCIFDRFELSFKSRNRRKQFEILRGEKVKCSLPKLYVKVNDDPNHIEASKLYSKSNQFRFARKQEQNTNEKQSVYFEIYRDNGDKLGICSTITYTETENCLLVDNWAISCRYFEIGLEEFILLYISGLSESKPIYFVFQDTGLNLKALELINKYSDMFVKMVDEDKLEFIFSSELCSRLIENTNLILKQ